MTFNDRMRRLCYVATGGLRKRQRIIDEAGQSAAHLAKAFDTHPDRAAAREYMMRGFLRSVNAKLHHKGHAECSASELATAMQRGA